MDYSLVQIHRLDKSIETFYNVLVHMRYKKYEFYISI